MPSSDPMLTALLRTIAADLKPFAISRKLAFFVGSDPMQPYFILAGGGHRGGCVICAPGGDTPIGGRPTNDMTDATFDIYVGHARDMRADPNAWLYKTEPVTQAASLLEHLDAVRHRLLTLGFALQSQDAPALAKYAGCAPAIIPGTDIPLPAWRLTVSWPWRTGLSDNDDYRIYSREEIANAS